MIEVTKGPTLPKQTLREWVLQQRRSARSAEAVDRFSEVLKALDGLTQNKPVRSVSVKDARLRHIAEEFRALSVDNPLPPPPPPGATPELETVASAEDAAGETMDQVAPTRPRKARKSWTKRNVLKPNVTRKASRIVKRSAKEERNQRNQRNAEQTKLAEGAAWTGLQRSVKKPTRKGGRPQQGAAPMTPAERVKAYRERKRAEASKATKGGKARRGRPKK